MGKGEAQDTKPLRTAKKCKCGVPEIKLIEIQVSDVRAVQRKEGRYGARACARHTICTIVVLRQEWERVSEAGSKYHIIDSRQDLEIESVIENHSSETKLTVPFFNSTRPDRMGDPSGIGKNRAISPTRVVFLGIRRRKFSNEKCVALSITVLKMNHDGQPSIGHIRLSGLNVMEELDLVKLVKVVHISPGKTGTPC